MKNTIVITGPGGGKTRLAKSLAKEEEMVFVNETELKSPFAFSACTPTTKYIVIDDVSNLEAKELKELSYCEELKINRRGKQVFTIERPTLILITSDAHETMHEKLKKELKRESEMAEYLRGVIRDKDELIELYREVKFLRENQKSLF